MLTWKWWEYTVDERNEDNGCRSIVVLGILENCVDDSVLTRDKETKKKTDEK